ncbi:hypothetical protein LROSL1_1202 [Furfurilactobacillus rossiae]|uniref:GDSL-type esterase/lipase family protein n=1 Tax=Furfurilactobacillus rossiae TaxID=231049 RepID=UPI0015C02D26|nr:GDSL-type esterase/lipase family protein [Furfurilactobacillus rossiae]QLE64019.1 hypothetical protein LROSL1_1202 [Furfurilactobacillus rossiae]
MIEIQKLIMFGDSITEGWTGSYTVEHTLDHWIAKQLDIQVDNHGHGGGRIVGDRANDLMTNINAVDLTQYDSCTIAYGINDFDDINVGLDVIQAQLNAGLDAIYKQNPTIQVFGLLPLPVWFNQDNQNTPKAAGYTENELIDALTNVYVSRGIYVLDWRLNPVITAANHKETLGDGVIHPAESTYELLGKRIAEFLSDPQTPLQILQSYKYVLAAHKERKAIWGEWGGRLRVMISNDGDVWRQLPTAYPDMQVRDPSMMKLGDTYYIIFTGGLLQTTDFVTYEDMHWTWSQKAHPTCWAPEFFVDAQGKPHVLYAGNPVGSHDQWSMNLYAADFDPEVGPVDGTEQQMLGDMVNLSTIDANLTYFNGQFHLFYDDNATKQTSSVHYATSDNYLGPYHTQPDNINADKGNQMFEGPELFLSKEFGPRLLLDPFNTPNEPQNAWQSDGRAGESSKLIMSPDFLKYSDYKPISSIDDTPFQIRHAGFLIDGNQTQGIYLYRLNSGWYLKNAINQAFSAINQGIESISDSLADDYGTEQVAVSPIPVSNATVLGRQIRLDMLSGFRQAVEELNAITSYFNEHRFTLDGQPLSMISVAMPHQLVFTSSWLSQYNDGLTQIETRLNLLLQILTEIGL